tara:strand:+ start:334 stop:873 length:540 start_codon:yes stop_codon:yes gene_type:complete
MRAARVVAPFQPPKRRARRSAPDDELDNLRHELSAFHQVDTPGQDQVAYTITTDGRDKLKALSTESDCAEGTLDELIKEACEMDKRGEMDYQFVFFALQGGNLYKQPTDVRDFEMVYESSVPYHTSRPDYKLHGTIVKMPLPQMMAPSAIVCHVFKGPKMAGIVATLAEYNYEEMYSVM